MIQLGRSGSASVLPHDNWHVGKALESPVQGKRSICKPIHIRLRQTAYLGSKEGEAPTYSTF